MRLSSSTSTRQQQQHLFLFWLVGVLVVLAVTPLKTHAFVVVVTPPSAATTSSSSASSSRVLATTPDKENDHEARAEVAAAVQQQQQQHQQQQQENSIECFVVDSCGDYLLDGEDGEEKPEVICTSHPEEYAWLNGIDPRAMKPTDGMEEGSLECVEGHPTRGGVDEYECKRG